MSSDSSVDSILGRVPSGIYILTVSHNGQSTGMLASWVMQAGFEPPMVTVAVKRGRFVCDWLTDRRAFVLNVVKDSDKVLLKHFARGFEPGAPAFEGLGAVRSAAGIPVLPQAVGHLECEPVGFVDSEDHRIFLAQVVGGQLACEDPPMVHIRKTGKSY